MSKKSFLRIFFVLANKMKSKFIIGSSDQTTLPVSLSSSLSRTLFLSLILWSFWSCNIPIIQKHFLILGYSVKYLTCMSRWARYNSLAFKMDLYQVSLLDRPDRIHFTSYKLLIFYRILPRFTSFLLPRRSMTSIDLFLAIKRSLEPVQLGNCNVYIIYKLTMWRLIINFNLMRAKLDRLVRSY